MSRIEPNASRIRPPAKPTTEDLRRRATARINEKIDLTRARHKPLSLLRMEARRIVEQYLEIECPQLSRMEREKLLDEVLADFVGLGPLEELFRDESVLEIMVLAHNQVIVRKGEIWLPSSVHFKDAEQYRHTLTRMIEQGESLVPQEASKTEPSMVDMRVVNGFRLVAVIPPPVMELPAMSVFQRAVTVPVHDNKTSTPQSTLGPIASIPRTMNESQIVPKNRPINESQIFTKPRPSESMATKIPSGSIAQPMPRAGSMPGSDSMPTSRIQDPYDKLRQKVTERMITRLAAAGVFDLSQVPKHELQRVLAMYVEEIATAEKLFLDNATRHRITNDILTGMHR